MLKLLLGFGSIQSYPVNFFFQITCSEVYLECQTIIPEYLDYISKVRSTNFSFLRNRCSTSSVKFIKLNEIFDNLFLVYLVFYDPYYFLASYDILKYF